MSKRIKYRIYQRIYQKYNKENPKWNILYSGKAQQHFNAN